MSNVGRRYGFIRFLEIQHVKQLEKRLDSIFIGNQKMYVNLPRFDKKMHITTHPKGNKKVRGVRP